MNLRGGSRKENSPRRAAERAEKGKGNLPAFRYFLLSPPPSGLGARILMQPPPSADPAAR
jgi:hypothetical protein